MITPWNTLASLGSFSAIGMARLLFPDGVRKARLKRIRFLLLALLFRSELKRLYHLFREPQFTHLPDRYPEVLDKPLTPYLFATSSPSMRAQMVESHYRILATSFPYLLDHIYLRNGVVLGHYPEQDYSIRLGYDRTFRREGEMNISIESATGERLYSCSFALGGSAGDVEMLVGAVQGPESRVSGSQELIKRLTKSAYGLRPRSLVVQLALMLADAMGIKRVLAVKQHAHVYQAKRFSKAHKAQIHINYDELWQEFSAEDANHNFVNIRLPAPRELSEVPAHKRAMYRRRYHWLSQLGDTIETALVQLNHHEVVIQFEEHTPVKQNADLLPASYVASIEQQQACA